MTTAETILFVIGCGAAGAFLGYMAAKFHDYYQQHKRWHEELNRKRRK